jgi:arylsulfatase A-like enzyme
LIRLNILYLHSRDTERLVQPYSHPVTTSHLQQFAEEGLRFRQVFAPAPTCSPGRASLLTGTSAHCNGMLGLAQHGFGMRDYSTHMLHTLRDRMTSASGIHSRKPPFPSLSIIPSRTLQIHPKLRFCVIGL